MLRREFIEITGKSLLFLYVSQNLLAQEKGSLEKVIKYLEEKGTKTSTRINNQLQLNYEYDIKKEKDESILYQLQVNNTYFLVINNTQDKKGLFFDFNRDEKVDIYIEQDGIGLGDVMKSIDDALDTRKGKSIKNKNLKNFAGLDDKTNLLCKQDLE